MTDSCGKDFLFCGARCDEIGSEVLEISDLAVTSVVLIADLEAIFNNLEIASRIGLTSIVFDTLVTLSLVIEAQLIPLLIFSWPGPSD